MKLEIYGKKDGKKAVIKTYTAESYDLEWGTCEDVLSLMQIDKLETGSEEELYKMALNAFLHSADTLRGLFLDIFEGITSEELRGAKVKDMVSCLVEVVRFTLAQINLRAPKN